MAHTVHLRPVCEPEQLRRDRFFKELCTFFLVQTFDILHTLQNHSFFPLMTGALSRIVVAGHKASVLLRHTTVRPQRDREISTKQSVGKPTLEQTGSAKKITGIVVSTHKGKPHPGQLLHRDFEAPVVRRARAQDVQDIVMRGVPGRCRLPKRRTSIASKVVFTIDFALRKQQNIPLRGSENRARISCGSTVPHAHSLCHPSEWQT